MIANIREKDISILAENLNPGLTYLITTASGVMNSTIHI
jgi:hypothetical protein